MAGATTQSELEDVVLPVVSVSSCAYPTTCWGSLCVTAGVCVVDVNIPEQIQ